MMRSIRPVYTAATTALALVAAGLFMTPIAGETAPINFSGTVSYQGSYTGDTLYVAVLDTTGVEDVTLLDLKAYAVGSPPFDQAYSLDFDNSGVGAMLMVASLLDTDGAGVDSISGDDVFGWYNGSTQPAALSSASSQTGLDFSLPLAEIHGTLTFAPSQTQARVDPSWDLSCVEEGFRPGFEIYTPGAYAIIGLYPGSYCVSARGSIPSGDIKVCFEDATCVAPTVITLTATEVRTGVDFDFNAVVPVERTTWGRIKSLYP